MRSRDRITFDACNVHTMHVSNVHHFKYSDPYSLHDSMEPPPIVLRLSDAAVGGLWLGRDRHGGTLAALPVAILPHRHYTDQSDCSNVPVCMCVLAHSAAMSTSTVFATYVQLQPFTALQTPGIH